MVLLVDGRPVSPVRVATSASARRRGLLGCVEVEGALWLPNTASVHTVGMRIALDVATVDRDGGVRSVRSLVPGRLLLPRPGVHAVVEAAAGAFDRWGIVPGSHLAVTPISSGR